jgi:hypothetical protein
MPVCFPASAAYERVGLAETDAEKAAIAFMFNQGLQLPNYIRMKDNYNNANVAFALGYPLEFGDELLVRAMRMGQGEDGNTLNQLVAATLAKVILNYVHEEVLELTPAQRAEQQALIAQLDHVRATVKASAMEADAQLGPLSWATALPSSVNYVQPTQADYLNMYERYILEQQAKGSVAQMFSGLGTAPLSTWAAGELAGIEGDAQVAAVH